MENRYINLKELLPAYLQEFRELAEIMDTETPELELLEKGHNQIVDNRYIVSCDEDGIARYEKLLDLRPKADDSLADRIFRCITRWNISIPYNYAMLERKLRELCGNEYSLHMDAAAQKVTIKIGIARKSQYDTALKILDEIIPYNLLLDVSILYNQHKLLAGYPYIILSQFTHWELKNMDIPGNLSSEVIHMANHKVEDVAKFTTEQITNYGLRVKD